VTISEQLAVDLRNITADERQIDQVIMNLTMNAVEATGTAGVIAVSTRNVTVPQRDAAVFELDAGAYVCLSVKDGGDGMDAYTRDHMFEPFFTTKLQGRGLGLAAVYGIVQNHGGAIHVHTERGRGTRVDVFFPTAIPKASVEVAQAPAIRGGSETVLLIDDEEMVRVVTRKLLERLGYEVLTASTAGEATAIVHGHNRDIHVALLDMKMPDASAHKTLPILRETRPDMSVIICTGYTENEETAALREQGACGFLQKPFKIADLSTEIRRVLDQ
jgi:CheY-like chemotaxis protein